MKTLEELRIEAGVIIELLKKDIEHFKYFENIENKMLTPQEALAIAACFKPEEEDLVEMKLRFTSTACTSNSRILMRDLKLDLSKLDSSLKFYDFMKEMAEFTLCNFKETVEKVNEASDTDGKTYKAMHLRKTLYVWQLVPYDQNYHKEWVERNGDYILDMDIVETAKKAFEYIHTRFNFDSKWKRTEYVDYIVCNLEDKLKALTSVFELNDHLEKYKI